MEKTNINFYLNGVYKSIVASPVERVIDVLREDEGLLGTKEGCSDGDCGACTILIGKLEGNEVHYISVNSCLVQAATLNKASVVTIEGLSEGNKLNIIQEVMMHNHGSQCGFCTPGVVMSFLGLFANNKNPTEKEIELALEGNICRCTGYEGIKNSGTSVKEFLKEQDDSFDIMPQNIRKVEKLLDDIEDKWNSEEYLIPSSLEELKNLIENNHEAIFSTGHTDLGVREHHLGVSFDKIIDLSHISQIKEIKETEEGLSIGANIPLERILENKLVCSKLPVFKEMLSEMASQQVRNIASIGGNICNASPIGDCVVLLVALDASVVLFSPKGQRVIKLRDFYISYKNMNKEDDEAVIAVIIPKENYSKNLSFIKTGKRNAVDIASVNSASRMDIKDRMVTNWEIAFGGISGTVIYRKIKDVSVDTPLEDIEDIGEELSQQFEPLSDVRGSSDFRTLLIQGHLVKHFIKQTGLEV
jgi:xanthine dehydrogenase small subunit